MITIIRSDGDSFTFGQDFKILALDGFGGLDVEYSTQTKAFGDGDIELGKRIPSRMLSIDSRCTITSLEDARRLRDRTREFFNDDFKYKIVINYKDIVREIETSLVKVFHPTLNIYVPQMLSLVFRANDPLFKSVNTFGKDISGKKPLLGFPVYSLGQRYSKTLPKGMAFGQYVFDKALEIENDGDKATYFVAEITAKDEVQKFKLSQSAENYFLFNKTLQSGDVLIIDFENSYVTLNGVNSNQFVDKTSKFFTIPKGTSIISFDAEVGSTQVSVKLSYQKKYLGV